MTLIIGALALVTLSSFGSELRVAAAPEPAPDPGLVCPDIEGLGPPYEPTAFYAEREGMVLIFGSSARYSSLSTAECSYGSDPANPDSPVEWATFEVYWASPVTTEEDRARPCLLDETERDGVGVVTLGGAAAAYATYAVAATEPVDTAPFEAAARALLDQSAPLASSCEGVVATPPPATEVTGFLAGAFSPGVLSGDASAPAPMDSSGATPGTAPSETGQPAETEMSATAAETSPPESAAGWLRMVGLVAAVLSLVLLAATVVLIRREARIRPAIDIARVVVVVLVAVVGTALLADSTPPAAMVGAIVLGLAVGAWRGSKVVVRSVGDNWTTRRTGWSIVAFAVGIAVTQVAARLDSIAGLTLGLSTTFLSAALAAGVIIGRRGRLVDARRAAGIVALVIFALAATMAPSHDSTRADDGDPETVLADERTAVQTALVGLVDWSSVGIRGGLFADEGKPPVMASVPPAFDTAPEAVTMSTTWASDLGDGPATYTVEETYTFGLRPDGVCCTIDYVGTGTKTDPSGTVAAYEVAGRLDDIQSVAIEGSPTSPLRGNVLGLPFGEVQSFQPHGAGDDQPATADPTSCGRSVAETRTSSDLEETAGHAAFTTYRVDGVDQEAPNEFARLTLTTDCEVPGFTPTDALAVAPPVPPIDDPARGIGCPVVQEVLRALVPANALPGVDNSTTGRAFLEPNAIACQDSVTLGQAGPGETRHELMYQLAQPTDDAFGEDSSQVDEIYWTDLPLASDIPADLICAVDEAGNPVAPADLATGCQQVNRYEVDGVRVFVWTDWQTSDGPNVVVFVTAPWGSYSYRCHHCTPNDPAIGDFVGAVNRFGATSAAQIATVAETMPTTGAGGGATTPQVTTPDGAAEDRTPPATVSSSSDTDRSEPIAIASLLALGGAAAMLGLTLGELSGWQLSDPAGAGLEAGDSTASDALGFLNDLASFDEARGEYEEAGYGRPIATTLAALEALGGKAAGNSNPFGGIADNRVDQLSEAFLPEGVRSALVPSEVVKNNIRTALQAYNALTNSLGDSWYGEAWDLSAFDEFGAAIDARPGADPFAGYSQAMGLVFDELYLDGGVALVQDLVNLYIGSPDGETVPFESRVTRDDFVEALYGSADEFRDEVAGGRHGPVLQGLDEVFAITADLVTDPVEAIGGFVDDLANIAENGVGDGYWTDVAAQVHDTIKGAPVVSTIYSGYHELFSGVLSHAHSVEEVSSGSAQAAFAAEMAEGAAAFGAELTDFLQGGDNAVRAFDYVRSLF